MLRSLNLDATEKRKIVLWSEKNPGLPFIFPSLFLLGYPNSLMKYHGIFNGKVILNPS
jgi:hypothetical protein